MIKVLHITKDDKFFDGVYRAFEEDKRLENSAVLLSNKKDAKFCYIMRSEVVNVVNSSEFKDILKKGEYDVLFFHSLPARLWRFFNYIPDDKIVIWWAWGFELYERMYLLDPLINLDLTKPLTKNYSAHRKVSIKLFLSYIYRSLTRHHSRYLLNKVLKRVDYFQPVWSIEYEILKEKYNLHAKEFYYNKSCFSPTGDFKILSNNGNVMIGNSATFTNNHLDVIKLVETNLQERQKIIIPLSYGDKNYKSMLIDKLNDLRKTCEIEILSDFMPSDEYFKIFNSCSYACYGVIRQQAGGNISFAIKNGIKVFLYRESMAYRYYTNKGYVVYAIEDIDENSFRVPLNKAQQQKNKVSMQKEYERRQKIYNECINEIKRKLE